MFMDKNGGRRSKRSKNPTLDSDSGALTFSAEIFAAFRETIASIALGQQEFKSVGISRISFSISNFKDMKVYNFLVF